MPDHGGDTLGAAERYGGNPEEYIDFSANINPLGPPPAILDLLQRRAGDPAILARYPDPRYRALRQAISAHAGVDPSAIVIANGSTALFDATIRALRPASCLLPLPAFSEYAYALNRSASRIIPFRLDAANNFALDTVAFCAALERSGASLCVLTNPHNPSGNLLRYDDMHAIVACAGKLGITVVVDEAFIDYVPSETFTRTAVETTHAIVLRSLTKFFAIPALRVGYATARPALCASIEAEVSSWPVDTMAADAATVAFEDPDYADRSRADNVRERGHLAGGLEALGVRVFPSHANFLLIATGRSAADVTRFLAERHRVLVRDCSTFDGLEQGGFLRIAVRAPADNDRLLQALREVFDAARNPSVI